MSELDQYDYELPPHLIAQSPTVHRSDARLLVVNRADRSLEHRHVRDLPDLLRANDCLVVNDTRVVPARLVGHRTRTGGRWEGLFVELGEHGIWRVMGKTRGKVIPGETITLVNADGHNDLVLELAARQSDGSWIARPQSSDEAFSLLARVGRVPLPPYIRKGEMVESDREHYQTVFARNPGAVAAPTAGLHFTDALLHRLENQGVMIARLTLHVGLGTFRPITAETLAEHQMHSEWGCLGQEAVDAITACRARGGRVVAVGTTSVRVLETAAAGCEKMGTGSEPVCRDAGETACSEVPVPISSQTLRGGLQPFSGHTQLFIRPPCQFRTVDAMLTNFHLPRTTLLVLVRTFGGDELIRRAYDEAIREEYRFYSYGDAMLIV